MSHTCTKKRFALFLFPFSNCCACHCICDCVYFFLFSPSSVLSSFVPYLFLVFHLSLSLSSGVKCKAETGAGSSVCASPGTPRDGGLSGPRTSPAFVSSAGLRQQEREEEQAFNKNIVCAPLTQSATLCAPRYRDPESRSLTPGLRGQAEDRTGLGL